MAAVTVFRFVISDPKTGQSWQRELEKKKAAALTGTKVGDEIDGGLVGLPGYRLIITGGSDEAGFPIRRGVAGPGRKRLLLAGPPGYWPAKKGIRKRKTIRGTTVSEDLVQVNVKISKEGKQSLAELGFVTKAPKAKWSAEAKEGAETKEPAAQ